jgi:Glycosyl hydrolases family 16
MTASAGGVFKNFTPQLNAAILALSINSLGVAFGDVVVNTPATQSVTLTSSGNVPATINGATLTGAGFTLLGTEFPATLNPSQTATLNIEFDPTAVSAATGQLTISSSSSTNGTAMSGTVTATPAIAVAVTPATASTTIGAIQQFAVSVTRSSDTAVTWTVSGNGCSGIACGTISSSGLFTAPAAVPSSATVTITATSESDPTKSASADATIVPPQATGYNLVWEDTFPTLDVCTTNILCNWYNPGVGFFGGAPSGVITNPSGTYLNLNLVSNQDAINATLISTASPNGSYFHAWTFGYFEISLAFNPAVGSWPGLWLVPLSNITQSTQKIGEIDIFEWQSNIPTTFNGTLHTWSNGTLTASEGLTPTTTGITWSNFNTYGLLWTPGQMCWYLNNISMGCQSTAAAPFSAAFNESIPYALIIDQGAGCYWINPGTTPCAGQVYPLNMQVQWVHVYASPSM